MPIPRDPICFYTSVQMFLHRIRILKYGIDIYYMHVKVTPLISNPDSTTRDIDIYYMHVKVNPLINNPDVTTSDLLENILTMEQNLCSKQV